MKTIIVYYSFTGNNEALVKKLQERLQCDVLRIEERSRRTGFTILLDLILKRTSKIKDYFVRLVDYDQVILVAPVWAGRIATPLQAFLLKERQNIMNYAFITLCGGIEGQKQKLEEALQSTMLKPPVAVEELWVNDVLRPEQRNQVKYTTPYRVKEADWRVFHSKLDNFVNKLDLTAHRVV